MITNSMFANGWIGHGVSARQMPLQPSAVSARRGAGSTVATGDLLLRRTGEENLG